jgi:hypothetical protein
MIVPMTCGAIASYPQPVVATDFTPNAVNWTNIRINSNESNKISIGQQITGISSTINLFLNVANSQVSLVEYGINSTNTTPSTFTTIGSGSPFTGDTSEFSISNNDWVFFRFTKVAGSPTNTATITVKNASDGNGVLDTFTVASTS